MAKKPGPNKDNLEMTRRIFLDIARKEFATKGYVKASTADIVAKSGMARGSLYYHFGDKKGLFRAVYEQLMFEMYANVRQKTAQDKDPWNILITTCLTSLDMFMSDGTRRIIVDVNSALSYGERIEILQRTMLRELEGLVAAALSAGYFKGHEVTPLTMLIFGMISESGRSFEIARDIAQARKSTGESFILLMEKARA